MAAQKRRGSSQLRAMLRKNWLLKKRHPYVTCAEVLLPSIVMVLLIALRTRFDTTIHPVQAYIRKGMFVEVGGSEISPDFGSLLEVMAVQGEHLAFAPDNDKTRSMLDVLSWKFPLLKMVGKVYNDEEQLEAYIRSDFYGIHDEAKNLSHPKIKGAVIFHEQGPQTFDYSIRLNHTWAFSGFPDVKTIMDVNGPYVDDLALGVSIIPTLQYGFSGFLTLQQIVDSFIIFAAQQNTVHFNSGKKGFFISHTAENISHSYTAWTQFSPAFIRIAPFPTRAYTDDEFQSIVKEVMGILYLLGFLYPISRLISYSVVEKEQRIKEGLYMMGLKDEIFHVSWFITYAIQFALSSAVITACTVNSLFLYSDTTLVFTYFFLFSLSAVMLSFLISAFFSRAKTAVAVGTLSFIGAFFPYYMVNDPATSLLLKTLVSLFSPTAFALGTVNFADYERAHVGLRWTNLWQASSGVNFFICLLMMILDTVLYCAVGFYLDKVDLQPSAFQLVSVLGKKMKHQSHLFKRWYPKSKKFPIEKATLLPDVISRESGIRYAWNFLFTKSFWQGKNMFGDYAESQDHGYEKDSLKNKIEHSCTGSWNPAMEAVSFNLKQQEADGRCIQIRNLHKVYVSRSGKCCAVNSLNLSLYENQILVLLGHNGAGKSTTISMLVGLLHPSSGDAFVFGKNIRTDMDEIRTSLGVCPQYDILFPELTVKEHLEIFATLKGVEKEFLESDVINMANEVGLTDKINTTVGALSGGMKRKLSLAIALIGNSKVVILDEPTSGMDPYSMRSTWQLIKRIKKGRIILLTTHSMDEADILGDRIAIMADGSLKCCGSSLFLKQYYGVGYTLTIVKNVNSLVAADIVRRHVPLATCISDVGTEMSFRLPLASSSSFQQMFEELETYTKTSTSSAPGIESFGISVTTLEEVFLQVSGQAVDEDESACDMQSVKPNPVIPEATIYSQLGKSSKCSSCLMGCLKFLAVTLLTFGSFCYFLLSTAIRYIMYLPAKICSCSMVSDSTFWRHFKALTIKRALSARRDRRTIVFQLVIPAVFLLFGLFFLMLKPHPDQCSITLTTSYFNPLLMGGGGGPIPFNLSLPISHKVSSHVKGGWIQKEEPRSFRFPDPEKTLAEAVDVAGPIVGRNLISMSEYLITSLNESYQSRYGAVVMDDQLSDGALGYTVLHNSTCQHGAPTFINLMNAAILRLATGDENMTIQARNHPLPMTRTQHMQHHDLDAFSAAIIVTISFSFIPASFAVAIVKEREVKAKHQQLISGVSVLSYWVSTYMWDFLSFLLPASFAIMLFFLFELNEFVGNGCFTPLVIIFMEYGLAVASSTYCLTFFFSDHSMAQNVILLVHVFFGLILMIISFIMGLVEATKTANSFLKNFFRLSPGFCFADGLASLALRRQDMKLRSGSGNDVLAWNVTGASICYLGIQSIAYFLLVIGIEFFPHGLNRLAFIEWWNCAKRHYRGSSESSLEPLLGLSEESHVHVDEDVDVQAERNRVISDGANGALIYLHNLRKVYPSGVKHAKKVAVDSLTFCVQAGECFGFLGTNGAGKTTTLSMLSGEEFPTAGTAYIFGNDIRLNPKAARRHVGYCPQFDALLEFLTTREHLVLYARIKEVPEMNIEKVVDEKLEEFDLRKHANKPSFSLSGGNKRKLSVAIAMIGNPPIVILDEPSTGMDPIAKRFMWEVISHLSTRQGKTAVILTTHSMNEAQALCTRIGIMVGGQLKCIGSPQHLKTRFGNHLELEIKATEVRLMDLDNLCSKIQEALSDFPCHTRSILRDLEVCIGGNGTMSAENASEISLTREIIVLVARWLGNEECVQTLVSSTSCTADVSQGQILEQLVRDGGVPLRIFSEWWLTKEKFLKIDRFIMSSFPGATFHGCSGLSIKYQLPYAKGSSLADIFGHLEHSRSAIGIEEYSVSQSTLETIFNHFAASQHTAMQ